jgi:nitrate reductase gamma subunit
LRAEAPRREGLAGPEGSRGAQNGATGERHAGEGRSQALSLLADTFAVVLLCVAKLRGLLPWPTYLVYGGGGLTDGLAMTPIGVAMAALAAVGLFKLVVRRTRPIRA